MIIARRITGPFLDLPSFNTTMQLFAGVKHGKLEARHQKYADMAAKGYTAGVLDLLKRLQQEFNEFCTAYAREPLDNMIKEAADMSNVIDGIAFILIEEKHAREAEQDAQRS